MYIFWLYVYIEFQECILGQVVWMGVRMNLEQKNIMSERDLCEGAIKLGG